MQSRRKKSGYLRCYFTLLFKQHTFSHVLKQARNQIKEKLFFCLVCQEPVKSTVIPLLSFISRSRIHVFYSPRHFQWQTNLQYFGSLTMFFMFLRLCGIRLNSTALQGYVRSFTNFTCALMKGFILLLIFFFFHFFFFCTKHFFNSCTVEI